MELKKLAIFTTCMLSLFIVAGAQNEVELAHGKPTHQSSEYADIGSWKAVDGNRDGHWDSGSCTHTRLEYEPSWYVDLEQEQHVYYVVLTNRQDCCWERLHGAIVTVGNNPDPKMNPQCGIQLDMQFHSYDPESMFVCSDGMMGQYVGVYLSGQQNYLTLCEVEVFGIQIEKDAVFHDGLRAHYYAQDECEIEGQNLLKVNDHDTLQDAMVLLQDRGIEADVWVDGVIDYDAYIVIFADGQWMDIDSIPIWHVGEPNGSGTCVHLWNYNGRGDYVLDDTPCANQKLFICR